MKKFLLLLLIFAGGCSTAKFPAGTWVENKITKQQAVVVRQVGVTEPGDIVVRVQDSYNPGTLTGVYFWYDAETQKLAR